MPGLSIEDSPLSIALEVSLSHSFASALSRVLERWQRLMDSGSFDYDTALQAAQMEFERWPTSTLGDVEHLVDRLFVAGFMRGVVDVGNMVFGPDQQDVNVLDWMKNNPNGFIPALKDLSRTAVKRIENVVEQAYSGEIPFDLDTMSEEVRRVAGVGESRSRLIVRTETAKATSLGRIMAWSDDPDRDYYDYYWIAVHDDRAKDISLKWDRESPYTYEEIRHLWLVEHNSPQRIRNRHTGRMEWQTSAYNCRCTAARLPKSLEKLLAEGLISQEEYEAVA